MEVLVFDTSGKALSVAISDGKNLLIDVMVNIKKNHSITLMPVIDFLVMSVDLQSSDLDRIAIVQGPGSYTSLCVAVAIAKALAYTLSIGLAGVSGLYALAAAADLDDSVVPIMDARRNNVYAGFYKNGQSVKADQHMSFTAVLKAVKAEAKVMLVGEVDNFRDQIEEALSQTVTLSALLSVYVIGNYGQNLEPADVNSFVPNYLKRVEAEENWFKMHKKDSAADYIKRI